MKPRCTERSRQGLSLAIAAACAVSCTRAAQGDRFVSGGSEVERIVATPDGRLRLALARGLDWQLVPPKSPEIVLSARADQGPTHVLVAEVPAGGTDVGRCADGHRTKLALAARMAGVSMTEPTLEVGSSGGEPLAHVQYAVPLDAKGEARAASALSRWSYVVRGGECLAVGVTVVVRARRDDPGSPDPDDLLRLERVERIVREHLAP